MSLSIDTKTMDIQNYWSEDGRCLVVAGKRATDFRKVVCENDSGDESIPPLMENGPSVVVYAAVEADDLDEAMALLADEMKKNTAAFPDYFDQFKGQS
jgi:hypothetical protein